MALKVSAQVCQRRLALLWIVGAGALIATIIVQSLVGRFGTKVGDVWGWVAPNVTPTLSLIIGTVVVSLQTESKKTVDSFLYRLAFGTSIFYLVVVWAILAVGCITDKVTETMTSSNLFLAPLQALASTALGVFFLKTEAAAPSP